MVETSSPQINISKIPISGGIAGVFVAIASMFIFLAGVPVIRYMFPAAVVVGCGVAIILHFKKQKKPSTFRILAAKQNGA